MKFLIFLVASLLLVSCNNKQQMSNSTSSESKSLDSVPNSTNINIEEHSDSIYANSNEASTMGPDENGIYQGFPNEYKPQNEAEENLVKSFKSYYKSLRDGQGDLAAEYLAPKMIDLAQIQFPDMTRNQIKNEVVSILIGLSKEMNESFKNTFEGFETSIGMPLEIKIVSSNGNNLVYYLDYAMIILCRYDAENYASWYVKEYMYAASKNKGKSWYFIEPSPESQDILDDFK